MTLTISNANQSVLEFYKNQPFDYHESVEHHVESIKSLNQIENYPPLKSLLDARDVRVFEVGCGSGWLSNAIAYHYRTSVTAIDFNPVAIEHARSVAHALGTSVKFEVADLFTYLPESTADVVVSLDVLHHTNDCLGALQRLFESFVAPGGSCFIDLYHSYGRKPFLDHFANLKEEGRSEEELLDVYRQLDTRHRDETCLRSWFRDQVFHPHETQHTLAELLPIMAECGMRLESTSINDFEPIKAVSELVEQEFHLREVGQEKLSAGQYYPGFFTILARKKGKAARKSIVSKLLSLGKKKEAKLNPPDDIYPMW